MATVLLSNQLLFDGIDADLLLVAAQALEAHDAVLLGKQGVILADAHVEAGMDVGAALTHQDVASQNARFGPRRLLSLSRPLRVEPIPFL